MKIEFTVSSQSTVATTTKNCGNEPPRRCEAYCDESGDTIPAFDCDDNDKDIWCCGREYERYCCANKSEDITCDFDDRPICPNTWWIFK